MVCPSLAKVRAPFATVVLRSTDRGTGKTHNMAYQASRMIATGNGRPGDWLRARERAVRDTAASCDDQQ